MKASILDLRRRMGEVLRSLDRGERVSIFYRGKKKALLVPAEDESAALTSVCEDEAFGMWADRDDLQDVDAHVRALRKRRF